MCRLCRKACNTLSVAVHGWYEKSTDNVMTKTPSENVEVYVGNMASVKCADKWYKIISSHFLFCSHHLLSIRTFIKHFILRLRTDLNQTLEMESIHFITHDCKLAVLFFSPYCRHTNKPAMLPFAVKWGNFVLRDSASVTKLLLVTLVAISKAEN